MHQAHSGPQMVPRGGKPTRRQLYKERQKPTIRHRVKKVIITLHLRQAAKTWKIHAREQEITHQRGKQWEEIWEERKHMHQHGTRDAPNTNKPIRRYLYMIIPTKRNRIVKTFFTKHAKENGKHDLTHSVQQLIGYALLNIGYNRLRNRQQPMDTSQLYNCPTCRKKCLIE